jgi:hypothetical protein
VLHSKKKKRERKTRLVYEENKQIYVSVCALKKSLKCSTSFIWHVKKTSTLQKKMYLLFHMILIRNPFCTTCFQSVTQKSSRWWYRNSLFNFEKNHFYKQERKKNFFQRVLSDKSFNVGAKKTIFVEYIALHFISFIANEERSYIYKLYSTPSLLLFLVSLFFLKCLF